ncbi:MAG: hypothetical protein ACXAC7_08250 [Candidatus Hodarchaeales archaeon]|jgi:general stress protein CsbA
MQEKTRDRIIAYIAIICWLIFIYETYLSYTGSNNYIPILSVISVLIGFITGGYTIAKARIK